MEGEEIRNRAIEYFKTKDIPDKCPETGCSAVKAWQIGEPHRIRDRVNYTNEVAKRETDAIRYFVLLRCGQCGKMIARYDYPQPA